MVKAHRKSSQFTVLRNRQVYRVSQHATGHATGKDGVCFQENQALVTRLTVNTLATMCVGPREKTTPDRNMIPSSASSHYLLVSLPHHITDVLNNNPCGEEDYTRSKIDYR